MSFCVVYKCKNRHTKKNAEQIEMEKILHRKISYHLFPKDIERRQKWLKALQLENYEPKKSAAVCSSHFKDTDYEINHANRKLKKDAVPHLLKTEIQSVKQIDSQYQDITSVEKKINIEPDKNNEDIQLNIENTKDNNTMDTCSYNTRMVHRSTSISPERIINSPIKTGIREVYRTKIKTIKRRLSISRYEHKKTQKKLCTLKNVLKDLEKRNLLTAEESDILQHLDTGT